MWYSRNLGYLDSSGRQNQRPSVQHHALVWPNDGKRGKLGRLADILTGKGPDMFLASNPNRQPDAADGPSRARWTGFPASDYQAEQIMDASSWRGNMPGTRRRQDKPFYDMQSRRYVRQPWDGMWVDKHYLPNERRPTWVSCYPHFDTPVPLGDAPRFSTKYDPRNWGQNGHSFGARGGEWHPVLDGMP